ncbi:hypothetical protein HDU76_001415 [Blyttiomyces sp. JEL0837]|nr:hypothetical protein HDU76_001415 [Blyttiomyces sp. JEL0837]
MPEECDGYAQLESVLRQESKNKDLESRGLPPQRTHGCCAYYDPSESETHKEILVLVGAPLELEIELLSVNPPGTFQKEIWEMNAEEKYREAPVVKELGTELYRKGDVEGALEKYTRALMLLESLTVSPAVTDVVRARNAERDKKEKEMKRKADERKRLEKLGREVPKELLERDGDDEVVSGSGGGDKDASSASVLQQQQQQHEGVVDPDVVKNLMQVTRLNYAACKMKLGDYTTVVTQCGEVLKTDPTNVKALFRRGQAYRLLGRDLDLAQADFAKLRGVLIERGVGETAGEWFELKREEKELEKKWKAVKDKEKAMFSKMFV